ncbi:hypothetical protein [Terricaulis silvestris]|uniref:hypothetical protein n=1 Tax=Terricaulis silvestris TaxID=2686094 RepID=UPI00131BE96A|nr:hypothetical protein [Terricaulis silvestris]
MRAVPVGSSTALFCERTQALFELNSTARLIWDELAAGFDLKSAVQRLEGIGASRRDAEAIVTPLLDQWLRLGHLVPQEIMAEYSDSCPTSIALRIGPLAAELCFVGDADLQSAEAAFGHFAHDNATPHERIGIVGRKGTDYLFVGDAPVGMAPRTQTIPRLKALLTEAYCASVHGGFLAHAALVSLKGKRVLLSGAPGAGKTTLTLALAASGFAYGGDDIVQIEADGTASGISFAAAAKSDAWRLLGNYVTGLEDLPIYERNDGKRTRYVVPVDLDNEGPQPIDVVLLLHRTQGVDARLDRLTPLQALRVLLESGYSTRHSVSAQTIEGLATNLSNATCARFVYDGLADAVALIKKVVHE